MYLPKLSASVLAVLFCLVSHAAAQVGVDSGLWEFADADDIEAAMVIVRGNSTGATGSGCIIRGENAPEVLTAAHVVDSDQSFTVSFHNGKLNKGATIRRIDRDADVAILQCQTPEGCSVLEVAGEVTEGDEVRVCGFGGSGPLRCFRSKVAAVGENTLIAFTYAIPGDSGGPVVNAAGRVVGVVSGGSVWAKRKLKGMAGSTVSVTAPLRAGACSAINKLLRR